MKVKYSVDWRSLASGTLILGGFGAMTAVAVVAGRPSPAPRVDTSVIPVHLERATKADCAEPPVALRDVTVQFCGDAQQRAVVVIRQDGSWFVREIRPDTLPATKEGE